MKKIISILLTIFWLSSQAKSPIPPFNQRIIDFVNTVMGKKVGRGECWDLAHDALNKNDAKWDGSLKFGKLVDPQKDTIYPGDVIQFQNVVLKYERDGIV